MKKIIVLIIAMVFIIGSLQVAAKGGTSGGSSGSSGSASSGGAGNSGGSSSGSGKFSGPAEGKYGPQGKKDDTSVVEEKGRQAYQGSMTDLERAIDRTRLKQQFRTRLMEQLRERLDQECRQAEERGEEIGRVKTREMVRIARQSAEQELSPEETSKICAAYQNTVWSGIHSRFGEALAIEGIKTARANSRIHARANRSAEQVEKALRVVARLHNELNYRLLAGDFQEDGKAAEELGKKMAAVCRKEQFEERLRESLQNGLSLEEAVDQLSD